MKSIWKSGIMGVIVGDALGCPVQFESREEVARHPVTEIPAREVRLRGQIGTP